MNFMRTSVTTRLGLLLLLFALIPTLIFGVSLWRSTLATEDEGLMKFQIFSLQLADTIDRNLFERYGDVQAFGQNRATDVAASDPAPLVAAMDRLVATYKVYPLMMFVDTDGRVLATNSRDVDGSPIRSSGLRGSIVAVQEWYERVVDRDYTRRRPFTAPGNDVSTGTVIVDAYIEPMVKDAYRDHDAFVIGFAAPVERDGEVIGYWYNMADFALVEEVFETYYQRLKSLGLASSEMTLLDGTGTVIVDFNPTLTGSETVQKTDAFMRLNLVNEGVGSAIEAVNGNSGYQYTMHTRRQVELASGYAHLTGALGYPGMDWSVLVRTERAQAAAVSIAQRRLLLIESVLIAIGAVLAGLFVGRRFAAPLKKMSEAAKLMAHGDLRQRVQHESSDELGDLASAMNEVSDYLTMTVQGITESATNLDGTAVSLLNEAKTVKANTVDTLSLIHISEPTRPY